MTRRTLGVLLTVSLAVTRPAAAQDPVAVDPAHHKVEFENARVRVLRLTFGPGDTAPAHDHPDGIAVFLSDVHHTLQPVGGAATDSRQKRGDVVATAAGKHTVTNVGTTRSEMLLIELKPGSGPTQTVTMDPVKLDSKHYSVVLDNSRTRVLRVRVPPGETSVEQQHPDHVEIPLTVGADGQPAGAAIWTPGILKHAPTNGGKIPLDVIIVELK